MNIEPSEDVPVACTLDFASFRERLEWIARLNRDALLDTRREGRRLAMTYRADHVDRVRELVRRERTCCAFLGFRLDVGGDVTRLVIEAPDSAGDALDAIFEPFLGIPTENGGCGCAARARGKGDHHGDG